MEEEDGRKLWMLVALWLYNIQLYLSIQLYVYVCKYNVCCISTFTQTKRHINYLYVSTAKGPLSFVYLTVYCITIIKITQQFIYMYTIFTTPVSLLRRKDELEK